MQWRSTRVAGSGPVNVPVSGLVIGLVIVSAVLLTGCDLLTESHLGDRHGLEWARGIADAVAERELGGDYTIIALCASYVDHRGYLEPDCTVSNITICYEYAFTRLYIEVNAEGQIDTHTYSGGWLRGPLPAYDDASVQRWLSQASETYRYLTGREDDTLYSYEVKRSYEEEPIVELVLYSGIGLEGEGLAEIELGADSGTIYEIDIL